MFHLQFESWTYIIWHVPNLHVFNTNMYTQCASNRAIRILSLPLILTCPTGLKATSPLGPSEGTRVECIQHLSIGYTCLTDC